MTMLTTAYPQVPKPMLSQQATRGRHPSPLESPFNSRHTVDSLPDELLCEIFSLVQTDDIARSWYRVLWVCRRWSAVGRAAACLWCEITTRFRLNRSFIVASLEYSQNSPLTITLDEMANLQELLPLFSLHVHRIRSFSISGELITANDSALATFLSHPFPSLETFEEESEVLDDFPPPQDVLIWQPDASGCPRLRDLIVGGSMSIKVAPTTVFPALRRLALRDNRSPSFTLESFTQFLSLHMHIERLELDQYNLAVDGPFATRTFPPTIRHFSFYGGGTNHVKHFLASFTHIPAHASFVISHKFDEHETGTAADITAFAARMFPNPPQRHLHTLSRVTSVALETNLFEGWTLAGRALPGDDMPLVELMAHYDLLPFSGFLPSRHLAGIAQIFHCDVIRDVRLTSFVGALPKAEWVALFDACPLLEHVAIEDVVIEDDDDAREGLFEALQEPPRGGEPRWPRLRRFTVVCQDYTEPFISLLPRALQVRAEQGAKVDLLRLFILRWSWKMQTHGSEIMDKLAPWFEEAEWKRFVNDARLDLTLPYPY